MWEKTGVQLTKKGEEEGDEEEEEWDEEKGEGRGTWECQRVGMAMSARAGDVWELPKGKAWEGVAT